MCIRDRNPDAHCIRMALARDDEGFLADELAQRERLGFPPFRNFTRVIVSSKDEEKALVQKMLRMMEAEEGVGLAAPQIGIQAKILVWQDPEGEDGGALANPCIVDRSDDEEEDTEGCLSVPGYSMTVPRALRIRVEGQNVEGESVAVEVEGLKARILQHEIDHLEGRLILDRTSADERHRVLRDMRERSLRA